MKSLEPLYMEIPWLFSWYGQLMLFFFTLQFKRLFCYIDTCQILYSLVLFAYFFFNFAHRHTHTLVQHFILFIFCLYSFYILFLYSFALMVPKQRQQYVWTRTNFSRTKKKLLRLIIKYYIILPTIRNWNFI